jgi:hypothetical protein
MEHLTTYILKSPKKILLSHLWIPFLNFSSYSSFINSLTLIRAAGGIYDFRTSTGITPQRLELQKIFKLMYSSKNISWVYLVKYFRAKTAFSASYRPKRLQNRPFFCRFWLFHTAVKVNMTSPPPPQGQALPPPIVGAPSSSGAARTVSSSF